jgi:hypothetical protein
MEDKKFTEGFLLGFVVTTLLWCGLFAYIIGQIS